MTEASSKAKDPATARTKPVPVRRCAACGEHDAKGTLLRFVRSPQGAVSVDPRGKAPGRGAYLCREVSCLDAGIRKGRLEHTLKVRLSTEDKGRLLLETSAVMGAQAVSKPGTAADPPA